MPQPSELKRGALASVLQRGSHIYVSSFGAESALLAEELLAADLDQITVSGTHAAGLNKQTWASGQNSRTTTFFQTNELKRSAHPGEFLPLCYDDIRSWYRQHPPDAMLLMLSPPDSIGICSFGLDCGHGGDLWEATETIVAHINPNMPRTFGMPGIPFERLSAFYEAPQELLTLPAPKSDEKSRAIATHAARYIGDGACLQTCLGKLPDVLLDMLHDRKGLRLHTGLMGDAALRLIKSDAYDPSHKAIVGSALGSRTMYDALSDPQIEFHPASVTHDLMTLAANPNLVTINSAISVDLYGQAYAEATGRGFMSGPGGATDFARGARASENGLRMIVLPSTAGETSRIVGAGEGVGPVSLSRFDIDIIVTEHGAADIRNTTHIQRAQLLIDIAAPEHREHLARNWSEVERLL